MCDKWTIAVSLEPFERLGVNFHTMLTLSSQEITYILSFDEIEVAVVKVYGARISPWILLC